MKVINIETLSILLVALFFWKSTNQNPAFSKSELFIFFEKFSLIIWKISITKLLNFL